MAKIGTIISTWLFGRKIGNDQFGNNYYLSSCKNVEGKNKRIVIYKGLNEPSKVPPMWHAWLHYMIDEIPSENIENYYWQKEHIPNLTGTDFAHNPSLTHKQTKHKGAEYEAWNPKIEI